MNSLSQRSLVLLALLLALPAQAQDPKPAPQKPVPQKPVPPSEPAAKPVAPAGQSRIQTALENAKQKALAGQSDKAAYQELTTAIRAGYASLERSLPDTTAVRARLISAVDEISERSQRAKIGPEEFGMLRVELLDADLQSMIAELAMQPDPKGVEALAGGYKQLADAVQELEPSASEGRTRAQALLDGLKQKPALEAADLEPLTEELAHARALRSAALLEKRAVAKGATRTDYARARDQVSDLLDLQMRHDPAARELKTKLVASIDELEKRGAESSLTHADFESLRKELAQRGRTAPVEKQKPHG